MALRSVNFMRITNATITNLNDVRTINTSEGELLSIIKDLKARVSALEQGGVAPSSVPVEVPKAEPISLSDLTDVDLDSVEDGATLGYDGNTKKWVPYVMEDKQEEEVVSEPQVSETVEDEDDDEVELINE